LDFVATNSGRTMAQVTARAAVVAAVVLAPASAPVFGRLAVAVLVWLRAAVFAVPTRAKVRSEFLLEMRPDTVRILRFDFELPFFLL
jgi:hypothetical protein